MKLDPPPVRTAVDEGAKALSFPWMRWFPALYTVISTMLTMSAGGTAYTVATLPTVGIPGRRAWVTDALAPTFLTTVVGGGAVVCPVFDNGVHWVAG
jgi:hypothetical protein